MNLLYYCWNENSAADIEWAFTQLGHSYAKISYPLQNYDRDADFESQLHQILNQYPFDCIFTFNYFPILSGIAKTHHIPYISWIYDCPNLTIYSRSLTNPCNYLFLFDRHMCGLANALGAKHIFHKPLAVNTRRLNQSLLLSDKPKKPDYRYSVSFVGSLYDNNMYDQIRYLPDKLKGFFEGAMRAQQEISGYHFLEELITKELLTEALSYIRLEENPDYPFPPKRILTNILDQKITSDERIRLLSQIARQHTLDIFTGSSDKTSIPESKLHGYISYTEEMPSVFHCSKINLNISLRSITSGIPLRCLDIMGAHGFLLSNYQPELAEFFVPGEDFDYYVSEEDLLAKIDYYLTHDDKREAIAHNGWQKVQSAFSYESSLKALLSACPL